MALTYPDLKGKRNGNGIRPRKSSGEATVFSVFILLTLLRNTFGRRDDSDPSDHAMGYDA